MSAGDSPAYSAFQLSFRTMLTNACLVPLYAGYVLWLPSWTANESGWYQLIQLTSAAVEGVNRADFASKWLPCAAAALIEQLEEVYKMTCYSPWRRVLTTSSGCSRSTDARPAVQPAMACVLRRGHSQIVKKRDTGKPPQGRFNARANRRMTDCLL